MKAGHHSYYFTVNHSRRTLTGPLLLVTFDLVGNVLLTVC